MIRSVVSVKRIAELSVGSQRCWWRLIDFETTKYVDEFLEFEVPMS